MGSNLLCIIPVYITSQIKHLLPPLSIVYFTLKRRKDTFHYTSKHLTSSCYSMQSDSPAVPLSKDYVLILRIIRLLFT
jgi:hypothetical protein